MDKEVRECDNCLYLNDTGFCTYHSTINGYCGGFKARVKQTVNAFVDSTPCGMVQDCPTKQLHQAKQALAVAIEALDEIANNECGCDCKSDSNCEICEVQVRKDIAIQALAKLRKE